MGGHQRTPQTKHDDISMKTKLILNRFGGIFGTLKFDEKPFFDTLLGVSAFSDYKPTNAIYADSPGV